MLLSLNIKDFALIDKADIKFTEGLNMLTGETGAGKSILIDSINFILGNKQTKDIIRIGSKAAYVEGIFEIKIPEIDNMLLENGIEIDENIIISREINQNGKSVSRINGKAVTVGFLKSIGKYLIDIHGQHEHQSLLQDGSNIKILDLFCGNEIEIIKNEYNKEYEKYNNLKKQIEGLYIDEKEKLRKIDLLSFQTNEISDAALKLNEDEELLSKKIIMTNAQKIYSSLNTVYEKIYMSPIGDSAYDALGSATKSLNNISEYDGKLKVLGETLEDIYYRLESVIDEVRSYRLTMDFNEDELNEIEERLDTINTLKRKYGSTIEEVIDYNDSIINELSCIEKSEETIKKLENQSELHLEKVKKLGKEISKIRKENAKILKRSIEEELKQLGMEKAIFKVEVIESEEISYNGIDRVTFLMTANPGLPLKPLSKVASGGEISRIMLAIKTVIANIDSIPTLIFDEVDTGISGRTAQAVGEKMAIISKSHQILCVTHLPQIAAMSDNHFKIEKTIKENITYTKIKNLTQNEKIEELARMLGGAQITDLTRKNALEVLNLANSYKVSIKI